MSVNYDRSGRDRDDLLGARRWAIVPIEQAAGGVFLLLLADYTVCIARSKVAACP
jgi:hypothetical protein